ncbi:hypothetical protein LX15_004803 [Streptoalloteichus tenebrarius]|uniref:Uncharacterized protein n=1 Tax=Streptoalloteichus tenebrarius (strain ATCC 17920 / DSM 40477 / JCM 4838 / CBS 697.72 / NBRC 16177 / NCIMB 11028 / NRRL B-12390 / A12253. 1 / ISP 5477) TaxID=1933 RepID=A0ABT1HZZ8_STRSD|nr:minor capsid protein [Streptoalloteichus tenebrarius]MCP2261083.1 hypothetical protein [Streptoalloteichus tenebrarius]BFF03122.1 hypothetical protein GCM10020241_47970 [Streptoalloteichus tenebrarius]
MTMRVDVTWDGAKVKRRARSGAVRGLQEATEHLLGASRQLVPIEEGTLERSGVASVDDTRLVGAVSYDTPYAVRQHEELTWQHDPGRQAKYLEQPAEAERGTMMSLIAVAILESMQ